jgi:hypothetical protein
MNNRPPNGETSLKSRGISIEKEESKAAFLLNKWVILSFCGLALGLAGFGALKIYDYFYLQKSINNLQQEIINIENQQNPETIQKVTELDKAIENVKNLTNNHIFSSLFFKKLESLTLSDVKWSGYNINTVLGTVELRGQAASYSILAKQIVNFQDAKFEINVSGISLRSEGVDFSAQIKFDPVILLSNK